MDTKLDATVKFSAKYTQNDRNRAFSTVFLLDGRKMDVTKISGLFPDPHRMFPRNIFSEISKKIAGTVPAILIFTNSIRIFPLLS
jgi:hypothetical protein